MLYYNCNQEEHKRWWRRLGKEYALYKGDELLAFGTIKEISDQLKIKENTLHYYKTPSYIKRTSEKARRLIKI